ncbi:CHAT domain-containing protein [Aspergillus keveii]|uniref:CHAT domain-containing protein n=1 Tax=Aspergillus keveii TaxID=714993 RepID=A0ABR4FP37_9EURO
MPPYNQLERFTSTFSLEDYLVAEIPKRKIALRDGVHGHAARASLQHELGDLYYKAYSVDHDVGSLQEAVSQTAAAFFAGEVGILTSLFRRRGIHPLETLSIMLLRQFYDWGRTDLLEEAIDRARIYAVQQSLDAICRSSSFRAGLGTLLLIRYEHQRKKKDLADALSNLSEAIASQVDGENDREYPKRLFVHSMALFDQYQTSGDVEILDKAVQAGNLAVGANEDNVQYGYDRDDPLLGCDDENDFDYDVDWLWKQYLLAQMLLTRYEHTQDMDDIHEAISKARKANARARGNAGGGDGDVAILLARVLLERYSRTRSEVDRDYVEFLVSRIFDESDTAQLGETANERWGGQPDRYRKQLQLADARALLYKSKGDKGLLEKAIVEAEDVACNAEGEVKAAALHTLAALQMSRVSYQGTLSLQDMVRGVRLDDIYRDLASHALVRNAALDACKAGLYTPGTSPNLAGRLLTLGSILQNRYLWGKNSRDRDLSICFFQAAFRHQHSNAFHRLRAGRLAMRALQERRRPNWKYDAARIASDAVALLPIVCNRFLSREDQQDMLTHAAGLAADACSLSLSLGDVKTALLQVEIGRGVVLRHWADNRDDLSALEAADPELVKEYLELRDIAYGANRPEREIPAWFEIFRRSGFETWRDRAAARAVLETSCLPNIRQYAGYERFQLDPTVDELREVAKEGPVVIVNVTEIRSDAIIVTEADIIPLELLEMRPSSCPKQIQESMGDLRAVGDSFEPVDRRVGRRRKDVEGTADADFLAWLWRTCVCHVLGCLDERSTLKENELRRIWWIGSGVASSFPFHAAGHHENGSLDNTLSRCIPSYTPTINLLRHSRTRKVARTDPDPNGEANTLVVVVTMPTTPGERPLDGVAKEALAIENVAKAVPTGYTVTTLQGPSTDQVLSHLKDAHIAHFACHGSSDGADPANSFLLLEKQADSGARMLDRLTVSKIANEKSLGRAWIAYLSACSTAEVKASRFADEGIHLASAFQVVGFSHIIGSLWSANDQACVLAARFFYESLTSRSISGDPNRTVAEAWREAVLRLRSVPKIRTRDWAPFIHLGG